MPVFGIILVCIFSHSDRIQRDTEYLSEYRHFSRCDTVLSMKMWFFKEATSIFLLSHSVYSNDKVRFNRDSIANLTPKKILEILKVKILEIVENFHLLAIETKTKNFLCDWERIVFSKNFEPRRTCVNGVGGQINYFGSHMGAF